MNIERIKSDLVMRDLYFPECSVKRESEITSEQLNIDISKDITPKSDAEYDVTVTVCIDKPHKDLEVKVVARATFAFAHSDPKLVAEIIRSNTVAIMFPFIRSQVSLLTTQPGLTPVILPPINTAKLKD